LGSTEKQFFEYAPLNTPLNIAKSSKMLFLTRVGEVKLAGAPHLLRNRSQDLGLIHRA
jgi:hypothetical protein